MYQSNIPRLKICGITRLEDARYASGALVDYLGFIFHKKSPRYIHPKDAAEIIRWIEGPEKVGVFVNQPAEEVNQIVETSGIDLVQLHGDENPDFALKLSASIIKVFRIGDSEDISDVRQKMKSWEDHAKFYLFDTRNDKLHGGTGKTWDWSLLGELSPAKPFFIAGGISGDNMPEAISAAHPFGIDVSSSIESSPGIKDVEKMQLFFDSLNEIRDGLS